MEAVGVFVDDCYQGDYRILTRLSVSNSRELRAEVLKTN